MESHQRDDNSEVLNMHLGVDEANGGAVGNMLQQPDPAIASFLSLDFALHRGEPAVPWR